MSGNPSVGLPPAAGGRQIVPRVLSNVEPTRTRWAWEQRIPLGSVTILAGRQGLGKSTLLAMLSAGFTRGNLPGDLEGERATVLLATYEDDYSSTVAPRMLAAGADLDLVVGLDLMDEGKPDLLALPTDLELIKQTATEYKAKVLLIDPLMAALPSKIDSHRDQDVRLALAPLSQLASEAGIAIVAVLHLRKGAAAEGLDRISGSVAFTAAARSVLAFGRSEEDEDAGRILAHAKSNLGPLAPSLAFHIEPKTVDHDGIQISTSALIEDGEVDCHAGELLTPSGAEDRTEVDVAAEWLLDHLGACEWTEAQAVKDAAKAEGIAPRTLARARTRLGLETDRQGFPGKGVWRLPDSRAKADGTTVVPDAWHDSENGSGEPFAPSADSQWCQDPLSGTTGAIEAASEDQEADAERIAAQMGIEP